MAKKKITKKQLEKYYERLLKYTQKVKAMVDSVGDDGSNPPPPPPPPPGHGA